MLHAYELSLFALATLVMVITPGPNMMYCVSRTLCQGRTAGLVSLAGVQLGLVVHICAAGAGLTALLIALPLAFEAIKLAGAAYLLWLAWQAVKPGGTSMFQTRAMPVDTTATLFRMGLVTNLLNPKVAMFYLSIFPQFLHPDQGAVWLQSLQLGAVQILVSASVNSLIICGAAGITRFFERSPGWIAAQRYVMGSVLAGLALRIATTDRK
ncbi:MAG: LysE family translocator [Polaromonas sp.]|nr:LysE family translocator [Polaromonas sp.]